MSKKLSSFTLEDMKQQQSSEDNFWKEYYPKLQRYCHFLAQNKWDGDDIAQEAFIKAMNYYKGKKITSALLNKIAYNHWIDLLRKRKNETVDIESADYTINPHMDHIAFSVDLLLQKFTPKQAVIFLLKEGFQFQVKEIANLLGTTEMTVKASLHRAKKRLEKVKDGEESFSIGLFWNEVDREQLAELFHEALDEQDPAVLIQALPSIESITDGPKMIFGNIRTSRTQTPSSTLCMAA